MDKDKILEVAIYLIGFLVIWNICDIIFDLLIHRTGWTLSLFNNLGQPLITAIFVRLILVLVPKKK